MAKKSLALLVCIAMIASFACVLSACNEQPSQKIVYLGDSIAEAVLGASPLNEREYYGYYALVGKTNNFEYINRSVSGHKTSQLLNKITTDDDHNALRVTTHIKSANILHVSILGNDMLQDDLGALILEQARYEEAEAKEAGSGSMPKRDGIIRSENGSANNIKAIVARLRELNPTAVIIFQTVYNPVHINTSLIHSGKTSASKGAKDILHSDYGYYANAATDADGNLRYGDNGKLVYASEELMNADEAKLRELCDKVLADLNNSVRDYVAAHQGENIYIADATKAFGDIWAANPVRGRKLIYPDDVHPSNEGHAVMYGVTQQLLGELGLIDSAKALKAYKQLRREQFDRLFPNGDKKAAEKAINGASDYDGVTNAYFRATDGLLPSYC